MKLLQTKQEDETKLSINVSGDPEPGMLAFRVISRSSQSIFVGSAAMETRNVLSDLASNEWGVLLCLTSRYQPGLPCASIRSPGRSHDNPER